MLAYNRFSHDIDRLATRYESLHRGVLQHPAKADAVEHACPGADFAASPAGFRTMRPSLAGGRKCASAALKNEINVVPYIDVMLVLLVIFMVAAPMMTTGSIDLPIGGQGAPGARRPLLEVGIKPDQTLTLTDRAGKGVERTVSRSRVEGRHGSPPRKNRTSGPHRRRQEREGTRPFLTRHG